MNTLPADARCNGINVPITMAIRNANGAVLAQEFAASGTCNGNDAYRGTLNDVSRNDSVPAVLQVFDEQSSATPRRTYSVSRNSVPVSENDSDGRMYFVLHYGTDTAGRVNIGF